MAPCKKTQRGVGFRGARLWAQVVDLLRPAGGEVIFDLVPGAEEPRRGLQGRVLEWLMKRFTGGRGFERVEATRDSIREDLVATGFSEVEIYDHAALPAGMTPPPPDGPAQIVVFRCRRGHSLLGMGRGGEEVLCGLDLLVHREEWISDETLGLS